MAAAPKSDKSTGFVVKLYQMVNGAPNDILSVSVDCNDVFLLFRVLWRVHWRACSR